MGKKLEQKHCNNEDCLLTCTYIPEALGEKLSTLVVIKAPDPRKPGGTEGVIGVSNTPDLSPFCGQFIPPILG